jgi:hypothetical protein
VFTFDEFTTAYRKKTQFTVGEMYQRMLIQVPCFSTIKAKALAEKYPTFQALTQAMNSSIQWQQEEILYGLQHKKQRLGPKPKQFIYDLLTGG